MIDAAAGSQDNRRRSGEMLVRAARLPARHAQDILSFHTRSAFMKKFLSSIAALMLSLTLAACATGPSPGEMEIRQGTIEQINATEIKNSHAQGIGAVLGAAAGLGIGSLIGAGTGRDVAMVLGTLGGAAGGYEVAKHYDKPTPAQQIFVRLKNGVLVSVTQPTNASLRVGQRVYIEGTGHEARVMSQ